MNKVIFFLLLLPFQGLLAQDLPGEMYFSADGRILYTGGRPPAGLYDHSALREVHLDFPQANYWALLTSNYSSETQIPATMTIDGVVYDSVGVNFRGNTSYFSIPNSQKKSFAVSTDFIHLDQTCMGYKHLKFNNAHEDPTFMREVLYCQMAARHTPNAKANYIHLFLNNQDWGVYPDIQGIDKTFLEEYFLSNDGARFRATTEETGSGPGGGGGGPGWGDGTAGMNYLGQDTATYQKYYALKSSDIDHPWQKMIDAFQVLSTATASNMDTVEKKIDVDRSLWMLAVENIFTDDDSYVMKGKMDYYVYYEPETDRTMPIEYDGNSGFQANAATSTNWGPFKNVNNVNYPLLNKLVNIPEWRQRYLAHYRTILQETFTTEKANALIDTLDAQISALVMSDTKKLYTNAQYTSGVPGLKSFVANRRNFLLSNTEVAQVAPVIVSAPYYNSQLSPYQAPAAGEQGFVQATVTSTNGINKVNLYYAAGLVGKFTRVPMYDDGAHADEQAGDGIYGGVVPGYANGTLVRYYIEAIADNAAHSASYLPTGAEHDIFVYTVTASSSPNGVVINELLASNSNNAADEAGDHNDWIELYNNNDIEIDLSGYYLTDDTAVPDKWQIPAGTVIPANGYLMVWADDESTEGALHATFKLSTNGETLLLSSPLLQAIDEVTFGLQTTDAAYARVPNGTGAFMIQAPTFNESNNIQSTTSGIVINEILATNETGATDEAGDVEDWVELYNTNDVDVDLGGFYLTDDSVSLAKWQIPAGTSITAHGYLIIWADEETIEGPLHASWKLSAIGESVVLSDNTLSVLDSVVFGAQLADKGYARIPNGTGPFVMQNPTFNDNNEITSGIEEGSSRSNVIVYPNPFEDEVRITAFHAKSDHSYSVFDQFGRLMTTGIIPDEKGTVSFGYLIPGIYYLRIGRINPEIVKLIKL